MTITPPFPAILIDEELLESLRKNSCYVAERRVRLAIDVGALSAIWRSENRKYDIIYYRDIADKDYLIFYDSFTRIIPRWASSLFIACFRSNLEQCLGSR